MPLELDNPFWRFSLEIYASPGVAPECLTLQDQAGIDVNVWLFAVWLGLQGKAIEPDDLTRIVEVTAPWTRDVVKPLRQVRRHLKPLSGNDAAIQDLRKRVAGAELFAEQVEQARLYAIAGILGVSTAAASGVDAAQANAAMILAASGSGNAPFPLKGFWAACTAHVTAKEENSIPD